MANTRTAHTGTDPTKAMNERDEILALYDWSAGGCFRCATVDTPTTLIDAINTRCGDSYEVRACQQCVLAIEEERSTYAARTGGSYTPGRLGVRRP